MSSALKRLRQEGCHKFKTSLDYIVSIRSSRAIYQDTKTNQNE